MSTGDRVVTFQGHHSYIVSIAKLCKENGLFTDVTILCDDGKLLAHKIVLAAVSPFLRHVLDVETNNTGQTTIVMPEVRKEIVQQLLDFLYTGIMTVSSLVARVLQHYYLLVALPLRHLGKGLSETDDGLNAGGGGHTGDRAASLQTVQL